MPLEANVSDEDPVLLDVQAGVATLTLNRPERHNAFTDAMDAALWAALERVRGLREVGCVVLRGAGESFSSGRDMAQLGKRPEGIDDYEFIKAGHAKTRLLYTLDVPIIAALKGWVIGGSFERALLCDLRVASSDAKMLLPEVKHGVLCDSAGTARLFQ
ncbi:MAG: enoyl-CoA hydratase/carnithine racemase, partial [Glaciecola sp.]